MTNHEEFSDRHDLPIESNDDAALRMFGGATFGPGAKLILPSGEELRGDEANVFVALFDDQERTANEHRKSTLDDDRAVIAMLGRCAYVSPGAKIVLPTGRTMSAAELKELNSNAPDFKDGDNPPDSRFDDWTGNPEID